MSDAGGRSQVEQVCLHFHQGEHQVHCPRAHPFRHGLPARGAGQVVAHVALQLGTHNADVGLLHLAPLEGEVTLALHTTCLPVLHATLCKSPHQTTAMSVRDFSILRLTEAYQVGPKLDCDLPDMDSWVNMKYG